MSRICPQRFVNFVIIFFRIFFINFFFFLALSLAMARDGSSGGIIRTAIIDESGVERFMLPGNELPQFYGMFFF